MNTTVKNIFGLVIIIVILSFAYAAVSYVRAYARSSQIPSYRTFSVSADWKSVTVPDVAQFTFSVITEGGKDIAKLQKDNVEKINKAIDYVKKNGVETKDISTQSYDLTPKYNSTPCLLRMAPLPYPSSCPPPTIIGYTVTQRVLIKGRDFSKIGDLLSGVIKNGANEVSGLSFTIDDPSEIENQARAKAIAKAQTKALAIAEAGGFKVGKLLSIYEGPPMTPPLYANNISAEMQKTSPTIEPGSQDVSVSVTLSYEIE